MDNIITEQHMKHIAANKAGTDDDQAGVSSRSPLVVTAGRTSVAVLQHCSITVLKSSVD